MREIRSHERGCYFKYLVKWSECEIMDRDGEAKLLIACGLFLIFRW